MERIDLPNGCSLWRKPNEAGGFTYYTDENTIEAVVWDTCIVDVTTLIAAINWENQRLAKEKFGIKDGNEDDWLIKAGYDLKKEIK